MPGRRAAAGGSRIIAFPETRLPGYPAWLDSSPGAGLWGHAGAKAVFGRRFDNAVEVPGPATAPIAALAAELASSRPDVLDLVGKPGRGAVKSVRGRRRGRLRVGASRGDGPDGYRRQLQPVLAEIGRRFEAGLELFRAIGG